MPNYFSKPENALTRAQEMIGVDKKQAALEILSDVMKSKKHRTWQKVHEDIMMLFVLLCVELKKSVQFKEVIHQYKNMVYQVNPKTLEDVVKKYLSLAKARTEEARTASQLAVDAVDDLDILQTPESLMLSAVTVEGTQDRCDRTILTPWLKFLWESYRQCLDLLRNNIKFERLYHDVAQEAYEFCLKYGRKTEFRKLCDILRNHLNKFQNQITQKLPIPPTGVNLNHPDTQALHLETRLKQLDHAMNLELYMEAFKAVEDIWSLVSLSKKPPKPSLMANYYEKTALVFYKSGSQLFHAAALHKLLQLYREKKSKLSGEELQGLASKVMCATLAIPHPHVREHTDTLLDSPEFSTAHKQKQLANLLGLGTVPTRQSLLRELIRQGIPQVVPSEIAPLYHHMEVDCHPLRVARCCAPSMDYIREQKNLVLYIPQLEKVLIGRTLLQVAQMYQTIGLGAFAALCPYVDSLALERTTVELIRNLELPIRIDHRRDALIFGVYSDLGISQREDSPGGADQLASQLVVLGQALQKVLDVIKPEDTQRDECQRYTVNAHRRSAQTTHTQNLQRKYIIEERKETLERMAEEKEMEEESRRQLELRRQMAAEEDRLKKESELRERQRMEDETLRLKQKINRERYNLMKATEVGAKALADIPADEIDKLDPMTLFQMQVRQAAKQAQEIQEKARSQEKKFDHLTRAMRVEEVPLLLKMRAEEAVEARKRHEELEAARVESLRIEHARQLANRDRLSRMAKDVESLTSRVRSEQQTTYDEELAEWEKVRGVARAQKLEELKAQRKEELRADYLAKKRERREREKERRELEAKEREYEEKKAALERSSELQQKREREIDARSGHAQEDGGSTGSAWRPGQGKWRERERASEDAWKPHHPATGGEGRPDNEEASTWRTRGQPRATSPRAAPREAWRGADSAGKQETAAPRPSDRFSGLRGDRDRDEPPSREGAWRRGDAVREIRREDAPRDMRRDDGGRDMRRDNGGRDMRRDDGGRDLRRDDGGRDMRRDDGGRDMRRDDGGRDLRRDDGGRDMRRDDGGRDMRRDDGGRDLRRDDGGRDMRRDDGGRDMRRDDKRTDRGEESGGVWRRGAARTGGDERRTIERRPDDRRTIERRPDDRRTDDRRTDDRRTERGDADTWRRGGATKEAPPMSRPPRREPAQQAARNEEDGPADDGWTTVKKQKR